MENTTYSSPDQEILGYMNKTYSPECQRVLTNALAILYHVEYPDLQSNLLELLNGPDSEDTDGLSESFVGIIQDAVVNYLKLLGIEAVQDAELSALVATATALEILSAIEDPLPFIRLLETDNTPDVKLAKLVSEMTTESELSVLDSLHHVEISLMTRLMVMLEKQEIRTITTEEEINLSAMIENLKQYKAYKGDKGIGFSMLDFGFKPGGSSSNYAAYMGEMIDAGEPEATADNLISFYYLAEDTWKAPVESYRKDAESYIKDPKHIPLVEQSMRRILEAFEQYKRTLNEPK
jgi:hypothetical protein